MLSSSQTKQRKAAFSESRLHLHESIGGETLITTSRLRRIGNSQGVILNNRFIAIAGLKNDDKVVIHAKQGKIVIMQAKPPVVNTDLSTWDAQFKKVRRKGAAPEQDLFEELQNEFDKSEW